MSQFIEGFTEETEKSAANVGTVGEYMMGPLAAQGIRYGTAPKGARKKLKTPVQHAADVQGEKARKAYPYGLATKGALGVSAAGGLLGAKRFHSGYKKFIKDYPGSTLDDYAKAMGRKLERAAPSTATPMESLKAIRKTKPWKAARTPAALVGLGILGAVGSQAAKGISGISTKVDMARRASEDYKRATK